MKTAAFLILCIQLNALAQTPATNYFPVEFNPSYAGDYLKAMAEPSLLTNKRQAGMEVYRFLWLRSFDDPLAVRVERSRGEASVRVVRLTKRPMKPGGISTDNTIKLTVDDWAKMTNMLAKAGFFDMRLAQTERWTDGSWWILEGIAGKRYNVVSGRSPLVSTSERGLQQYVNLCLEFLRLAGIDVAKEKVY